MNQSLKRPQFSPKSTGLAWFGLAVLSHFQHLFLSNQTDTTTRYLTASSGPKRDTHLFKNLRGEHDLTQVEITCIKLD